MEAAELLSSRLDQESTAVMACLDLLLQWVAARVCDANTAALLAVLGFCKALLLHLAAQVRLAVCVPLETCMQADARQCWPARSCCCSGWLPASVTPTRLLCWHSWASARPCYCTWLPSYVQSGPIWNACSTKEFECLSSALTQLRLCRNTS